MADSINVQRELEKALTVLREVELYLGKHSEMNAALHCTDRVIYSPLYSKVASTILGLQRYVGE